MARPLRIGHRALETVRRDPAAWVAARGAGRNGFASYASITREAIYRLHAEGSLQAATVYLHSRLNAAHLRTPARHDDAEYELAAYASWLSGAPAGTGVHWRVRLDYELVPGVVLGGEVSRIDIDLAADEYHAVLLGPLPDDWPNGLRFPVLHRAIARAFDRDERQVRICVQRNDGSSLEVSKRFVAKVIDTAEGEAQSVAKKVLGLLGHAP